MVVVKTVTGEQSQEFDNYSSLNPLGSIRTTEKDKKPIKGKFDGLYLGDKSALQALQAAGHCSATVSAARRPSS